MKFRIEYKQIYRPSHTYLNLANTSKRNGLQSKMSFSLHNFLYPLLRRHHDKH